MQYLRLLHFPPGSGPQEGTPEYDAGRVTGAERAALVRRRCLPADAETEAASRDFGLG